MEPEYADLKYNHFLRPGPRVNNHPYSASHRPEAWRIVQFSVVSCWGTHFLRQSRVCGKRVLSLFGLGLNVWTSTCRASSANNLSSDSEGGLHSASEIVERSISNDEV